MGIADEIIIPDACIRCQYLTEEDICWRNKSPYFGEHIPETKECCCGWYKDKYHARTGKGQK